MPGTERLILRSCRRTDIPELFEFLGDTAAMQHTHAHKTLRQCQRIVTVHEWRRRHNGCAPWVAVRREDDQIIGWGGLYEDPFDQGWGFEIGYYFRPDVWGRGYALELATAALEVADRNLKLPEVWAMAHPENVGSRKVLEKAGFIFERNLPERNRFLFRRLRPLEPE